MTTETIAITLLIILSLFVGSIWIRQIGTNRGSFAFLCRILWISPIILAFFPKNAHKEIPNSINNRPIHILIDDSYSMQKYTSGITPVKAAEQIVQQLQQSCSKISCTLNIDYLSEKDPTTNKGYSPLQTVIPNWLEAVFPNPWIIISDGSNDQPTLRWEDVLSRKYLSSIREKQQYGRSEQNTNNLILGVADDSLHNIWIKDAQIPRFSFKNKPLIGDITIERSSNLNQQQSLQLQIIEGEQVLSSLNVQFEKNQHEVYATVVVPSLPIGKHVLTIKALANMHENVLWDNTYHVPVEVLTDTIGILHLLGEPSWDGRYLRRYLKGEPKYDLVSFFILRDPWDQQLTNEKDLSLIPFPVRKLFNEELNNFRVIVLQNFSLLQFLLPEYQQRLVEFIKNGGALLFIGGSRALKNNDLVHSPLKEILPFTPKDKNNSTTTANLMKIQNISKNLDLRTGNQAWYDPKILFQIKLAQPDEHQRTLANIYDELEHFSSSLHFEATLQGLHHIEKVQLKKGNFTPLLLAQTTDSKNIPLVVASYPDKGRAIWIFTDSLWRLANDDKGNRPREVYNKLLQSIFTWLLRKEEKQPLMISDVNIQNSNDHQLQWTAQLNGPAVSYINNPNSKWSFHFCDKEIKITDLKITYMGNQSLKISNKLDIPNQQTSCTLLIYGENKSFGSVSAMFTSMVPKSYLDDELSPAPKKLANLAQLVHASFHTLSPQTKSLVTKWLAQQYSLQGIELPKRYISYKEYYWIFDSYWLWLLILFLPLEVIIRRWHLLTRKDN